MSRTRWVVVDDSHPDIAYEGPWTVVQNDFSGVEYGTYGPTYNGSQHATNTSARVTFSFTGTNIAVYGTTNVSNPMTSTQNPTWECLIDNNRIPSLDPWISHQNNWAICSTPSALSPGAHNLTISVTSRSGPGTFFLDHIRYLPTSSAPIVHPTVMIEQTDLSVQYAGNWTNDNKEITWSTEVGALARVNFTGTRLTWISRTPRSFGPNPSKATYSVDGGSPGEFEIEGSPRGLPDIYHRPLFRTPVLSMGEHVLEVKHLGIETPLVLDYLLVEDGDFRHPTVTVYPSAPGPSSTESLAPGNARTAGSGGGTPIGAIVGGVMGGLAFIAILLFFLYRLRKKRATPAPDPSTHLRPTPFTLSLPSHTQYPPGTAASAAYPVHPILTAGSSEPSSASPYMDGSDLVASRLQPLRRESSTEKKGPPSFITTSESGGGGNDSIRQNNPLNPPNPLYTGMVGALTDSSRLPRYVPFHPSTGQ